MSNDFDDLAARVAAREYRIDPAVADRHLSGLMSEPAPPVPSSRRRGRVVLVAAVVVATIGAGIGTAAAFGVFSAPPTERGIAHCYATVDLDDPSNHTDFMVAVTPEEQDADGVGDAAAAALEVCSGGWAQGRFGATDPKVSDPHPSRIDFPVPHLVACVLPDGSVGVFPGNDRTCGGLNLPSALL